MFLSKNSQHAVEMPFTADYNHCIVVVFDFFLFFIRSRYGNHKINRFILFDIFFLLLLFVCSHDVRTNFRDHFYKVLSRGLTSKQQKKWLYIDESNANDYSDDVINDDDNGAVLP